MVEYQLPAQNARENCTIWLSIVDDTKKVVASLAVFKILERCLPQASVGFRVSAVRQFESL
jgi:hypothetical protein